MRVEVIGNATLYCGDCHEILPTLTGIDAVVTDPPYGIRHKRGKSGNRPEGRHSGTVMTLGVSRIIGDNQPFDPTPWLSWPAVMWGANYYAAHLPPGRWLVWDKIEHGGAGDFSEAEMAWHSRPGATKVFRHMWMGVQRASQCGERRWHETEKPVALMRWCIGFVPDAKTVLDPYMGSGTTGVACANLGRSFVGIEIELRHFDAACRRIEQAQRQGDLLRDMPPAEDPADARMADLFQPP